MAFKIIFVVLNVVSFSCSTNILAIIPTPSYSHQIAFTPLWRELSLRGHNVTVVTTDPINDPKLVNLTEIDVRWSYKYLSNITKMSQDSSTLSMVSNFLDMSLSLADEQLAYPSIQDLIRNKGKFDVVLVEYLFPEYLAFSEIYHCPKILIASLDTNALIHNFMGNTVHPVLYSDMGTPYYSFITFKERLMTTLCNWYTWYVNYYRGYPEKQKLLHKYFNISTSLENLLNDIDLLILNVNPVIQSVRAVGATTINIGGFRPGLRAKEPLPKDLQEFLDSAKNGFIYFSLGSNVKSKDLGTRSLNSITEAFKEVPYKVLWKFEADTLSGKPSNVKLVKWAPQQQILAHPNIKLFITQGGLQSMEEAIYSEVPFVVIPFFGDQPQNANLLWSKGVAKIVEGKPFIKKENLKSAILEVIQNSRYRIEVRKLKRLALDTPMTGLEKAVWWTEYVIRNKGTKHLRNPATNIPSYQYYLLDVLCFLFVVATLAASIIILVLKYSIGWLKRYIRIGPSKLKQH